MYSSYYTILFKTAISWQTLELDAIFQKHDKKKQWYKMTNHLIFIDHRNGTTWLDGIEHWSSMVVISNWLNVRKYPFLK